MDFKYLVMGNQHDGGVYTTLIGTQYKLDVNFFPEEPITKH
jgi:hypothetical protein